MHLYLNCLCMRRVTHKHVAASAFEVQPVDVFVAADLQYYFPFVYLGRLACAAVGRHVVSFADMMDGPHTAAVTVAVDSFYDLAPVALFVVIVAVAEKIPTKIIHH